MGMLYLNVIEYYIVSCKHQAGTGLLWQVHAVVGVLSDDTDPMVTVMKLEKAPQETYADIGGRWNCLWVWCYKIYFPLDFPNVYAWG
jgi:ATP-dependent 26S proteasome regulatory subunit